MRCRNQLRLRGEHCRRRESLTTRDEQLSTTGVDRAGIHVGCAGHAPTPQSLRSKASARRRYWAPPSPPWPPSPSPSPDVVALVSPSPVLPSPPSPSSGILDRSTSAISVQPTVVEVASDKQR